MEASAEQAVARGRDAGRRAGGGGAPGAAERHRAGAPHRLPGGQRRAGPRRQHRGRGWARRSRSGAQAAGGRGWPPASRPGRPPTSRASPRRTSDPYLKQTATKMFGLRLGALVAFNRPDRRDGGHPRHRRVLDVRRPLRSSARVALDVYTAGGGQRRSRWASAATTPSAASNFTPYVGTAVVVLVSSTSGGAGANGIRIAPGVRRAVRAAVDGAVPRRAGLLLQHLRRARRGGAAGAATSSPPATATTRTAPSSPSASGF